MKPCSKCKETKALEEFHKRKSSRDGRQSTCKKCNCSQRVAYFKTAQGRAKHDVSGKRWALQMRVKILDYLRGQSCADCGENNPIVLEFDHREPTDKSFMIARGIKNGYGWDKLMKEILKCDIRCANCHRKRTAVQFGWTKAVSLMEK